MHDLTEKSPQKETCSKKIVNFDKVMEIWTYKYIRNSIVRN